MAKGMLGVKEFFEMGTREFANDWKELTDEDKEHLKKGVDDGSLTY